MKSGQIFETEIGGRVVSVETGRYCELSNGSCLIRCGDTVVLTNVTIAGSPRPGIDFFPLGVDYEEKAYAMGKIPGGFKKREGRASDKVILTSRLIDRPLRPLFPKGLFNDVAIVSTVLSVDTNIPAEVFGMLGSSIALAISDIPFAGPTGSVVVGYIDGKFVINPDNAQRAVSQMHLCVSGTRDAIMMVEAGANMLSEKVMLEGIMFAHEEIKRQVAFIDQIVQEIGKPKKDLPMVETDKEVETAVRKFADKLLDKALATTVRAERQANEDEVETKVLEEFKSKFEGKERDIKDVLYDMTKEKIRASILKGERPDGRKLDEVRDIWCEVAVLPRTHGSGVFTRGQTQSLTTCTLGMLTEVQKLDNLDDETKKRYMHHYNFLPFSTGEAKPVRAPGRREIGHGALAERALEPVLPSEEEFPYAIRTVSEILSSNGSTSMASTCGSTLALMDAGVPIKAPVAGIAMGLIKDKDAKGKDKVAVLTDIQGLEDFLGDMDFKVTGTKDGVTAIQMDIKIKGIDKAVLKEALEQARVGRLHILDKMNKTLSKPRAELSKYAPKIISFEIDPDKIGDVIGKGGKVINGIIDATGVTMDIEDDGTVYIATSDEAAAAKAKSMVLAIVEEVAAGNVYTGKVVRILEFGAFVQLSPVKDGMIHISKLAKTRVEKVTDVINIGDEVEVEVIKVDDRGRVDLRLVEKK